MRAMLKWLALCGLLAASAPRAALGQPPVLPDSGGIVVPATWVYDVGVKGDTLYFTTESTATTGAIYKVTSDTTATQLARFNNPCLCFGYVQETLFVGLKNSGKVLRSDNGGTVWDTTGQLGGVASVYALLRLASGTFLVATGDNNGDVFQAVWNSDVGGAVMSGPNWANGMTSHGNVLYSTTNFDTSELWKSVDTGRTWTRIAQNFPGALVYDVFWDQETMYVGLNNSRGVWRSTNAGVSWDSTAKPGGISDVYCFLKPQGRDFFIGTGNTNGDIFQACYSTYVGGSVMSGPTWANGMTSHGSTLYSATNFDTSELWKSSDTGRTWTRVSHNFPGTLAYDVFWDQETMFVGLNNSRGVWRSTNAGVSWDSTPTPPGASDVYGFLKPQGRNFLIGTGNSNGDIFQACYNRYVGGGVLSGPRWANEMTAHGTALFACTDFDTAELWQSTDTARTWTRVDHNFPGTQLRSMHWDGDTAYVGMNNSQGVQRSNDGGSTWLSTVKPPDAADVYAFCQADTGEFIIGTGNSNGDVFRAVFMSEVGGSELAGANWVHAAATQGNELWAAAGTDTGQVWRWTPSSDTWRKMASPPANNILAIEPVGQNFYAGTDDTGRVYVSYDSGSSWLRTWPPSGANKTYSFLLSRWAKPAKLLAATGDNLGDVFVSDRSVAPDVGVTKLLAPQGIVRFDTVITPTAIVKNFGFGTAHFPTVMNIGPYYSETLQVSLVQDQTDTLEFPNWRAAPPGTYAVKCSTMYVEDYAPDNDYQDTTVATDRKGIPLITSVTPNRGGDIGWVAVDIYGAHFDAGMVAVLIAPGCSSLVGTPVELADSCHAYTVFNLSRASRTTWNVVLVNVRADTAVFFDGFTVEQGTEALATDVTSRGGLRMNRSDDVLVSLTNVGNVDADPACLLVVVPRAVRATLFLGGIADSAVYVPDSLARGDTSAVVLQAMLGRLRPGASVQARCRLSAYSGMGLDSVKIRVYATTYAAYMRDNRTGFAEEPSQQRRDGHTSSILGTATVYVVDGRGTKGSPGRSRIVPLRHPYVLSRDGASVYTITTGRSGSSWWVSRPKADFDGEMERRRGEIRDHGYTVWADAKIGVLEVGNGHVGLTQHQEDLLYSRLDQLVEQGRQGRMLPAWVDCLSGTNDAFVVAGRPLYDPLKQKYERADDFCRALGLNPAALPSGLHSEMDRPGVSVVPPSHFSPSLEDLIYAAENLLLPIIFAWDPNAKDGPRGSDTTHFFVSGRQPFCYAVHFENVDSATAPAETVVVTDRLDNNLDWSTLTLDTVRHPAVCTIMLDSVSSTITWRFDSIMLPPNRNPPEGEGWCRFSIMPRQDLPSGIQIRNYATIVFDQNPLMNTDTVLNTIDAFSPNSRVSALPETTQTGEFTVRWTGADDLRGSGIRSYDIYARRDTSVFEPWLLGTTDSLAVFIGANESRYWFYSVATDNVGWREDVPTNPDAHTFVNGMAAPVMLYPSDTTFTNDATPTFLWTATAGSQGTYVLQYSRDRQFLVGVESVPGLTDTTYTMPESSALNDTTWFWRVKAVGRRGTPSTYRDTWRLTVDTKPPASPLLMMPPDDSTVESATPRFVWNRVSDALVYELQYSPDSLFDSASISWHTSDSEFVVPGYAPLSETTYFWHVRAFDRAGNTGDYQPRPFTFFVNPLRSISGDVNYYGDSTQVVDSARMVMFGDVHDTVYTAGGYYEFVGVANRSNDSVAPEKTDAARRAAVTAFDAAMVLQHAVHRDTLDSLQFIAGDVSGDSSASAFDAALILQYAVAMRRHFPVGYRPGLDTVDWAFRPPQRIYDSLASNQVGQDYKGILFGDPSGNWPGDTLLSSWGDMSDGGPCAYYELNMPRVGSTNDQAPVPTQGPRHNAQEQAPARAAASGIPKGLTGEIPRLAPLARNDIPGYAPQAQVGMPSAVSREPIAGFVFPVTASKVRNGVSADMLVRYDAGRYTLRGIRTTGQTEGFMVAAADRGGYVRIAMAGTRKLNGDVALLDLVFGAAGSQASTGIGQRKAQSTVPEVDLPVTLSESDESKGLSEEIPRLPSVARNDIGTAQPLQADVWPPSAVSRKPSAVGSVVGVLWLVLNEGASDMAGRTGEGAMGEQKNLPATFYLAPPKPNPFGSGTNISYGLPAATEVALAVFDATGRKVRMLASGLQPAGRYVVTWNGKASDGRQSANGIYFVRMKASDASFERKATLVRE